jgi:hypothetical protein
MCLVLGIVLSGVETAESIDARWARLFGGWSMERPMLIGGALTLLVVLSLWLLGGKPGTREKSDAPP